MNQPTAHRGLGDPMPSVGQFGGDQAGRPLVGAAQVLDQRHHRFGCLGRAGMGAAGTIHQPLLAQQPVTVDPLGQAGPRDTGLSSDVGGLSAGDQLLWATTALSGAKSVTVSLS